ncbi:hypothetical protein HN670_00995 [bacterium]|jgi:hypothetical protein|nr:hypothetical protein [bacterium]
MDFLKQIGFNNILLLIVSLLNFVMMLIIIIKKGWKNKMYLYFSLLTFANFLWGLSIFLALVIFQVDIAEFWYRTCYLAALIIAVALVYFIVHFPYKSKKISITYNIFIIAPLVIIGFLVYTNFHITDFIKLDNEQDFMAHYFKPFYLVYSGYFLLIVVSAIHSLYRKFLSSEGVIRYQILILFITLLAGLIFGAYFDLFLIYFQDFTYVWLGPIFTLPMNLAVFYLIFFDKKQ